MTRINTGIPPKDLTDQHLLAELRELPRIPNAVKRLMVAGKPVPKEPEMFCLGPGHVKFFYDKLMYLHDRYDALYFEAKIQRKFAVKRDKNLFKIDTNCKIQIEFICEQYNQHTPTGRNKIIIKTRIAERIRASNQQPRYYRQPIDKEYYITKILKL